MAIHDPRPGAQGDEAELFRVFNDELVKTVWHAVGVSSRETVEDACSFAWAQFLQHQPDRDRNWRGWLFRTAQRQAWALEAQSRELQPLREFDWEDPSLVVGAAGPDTTQINRDVQDALSVIAGLRPRLRRIALLRGLWMKYRDIAAITGDSGRASRTTTSNAYDRLHSCAAHPAHA
jgi:DNA-directed RNA polymerase specialized sigma24 family protein